MSKDLKRRGFRFVGSTICYAFMQSAGLVDDHVESCFEPRHLETPEPRLMRPRNRLACGWALVVLIGVVINLVVLVVTPVLRPELNLLEKSLSYYAVGPWGSSKRSHSWPLASRQWRWAWRSSAPHPVTMDVANRFAVDHFRRGQSGARLVSNGRAWASDDPGRCPSDRGHGRRRSATCGCPGIYDRGSHRSSVERTVHDRSRDVLSPCRGSTLSSRDLVAPPRCPRMGATMRLLVIRWRLWGLVALRLRRTCASA